MAAEVHIDTELSDLFFNHEHPAREALPWRENQGVSQEDQEAACLSDAQAFLDAYETIWTIFDKPTAQELTADFMARL